MHSYVDRQVDLVLNFPAVEGHIWKCFIVPHRHRMDGISVMNPSPVLAALMRAYRQVVRLGRLQKMSSLLAWHCWNAAVWAWLFTL